MSQICSKMAIFLFSAYFVTIATVKVESMPVYLPGAVLCRTTYYQLNLVKVKMTSFKI